MATQQLVPAKGLSLSVPTGDGRYEFVDLPAEGIHPALLIANQQPPDGAASYRKVADQLLSGEWWGPRRIFVTSPTAGDGKTCTAFNLAWALNNRGASVLVAELNFARPQFRSFLGGMPIRFGVDCAIRHLSHPSDSVFSIRNEVLAVSAVKKPMRLSELKPHLPRLATFLNWGCDNFDWLVLDCPPVLSAEWNTWFRACARPALLVVRQLHTPAVQVRSATKRLGNALKGVLLNDVLNVSPSQESAGSDG